MLDASLSEHEDEVDAILADWLEAAENGRAPDVVTFLARHPQHAARLERCLADWREFQHWAVPLRPMTATANGETPLPPATARPGGLITGEPHAPSFANYEILGE